MSSTNQPVKDIYLSKPLQSNYDKQLLGCKVIQQPKKVSYETVSEKGSLRKISETSTEISFTHYELARSTNNTSIANSKYLETSYSCSCERSSYASQAAERCQKRITELKRDVNLGKSPIKFGCPKGAIDTPRANTDVDGKKPGITVYNKNDNTFEIYTEPVSQSLLQPAHFEVLLGGNCKTRAKTYSECAKNAYKRFAENCPDIPAYCKDEKKWLKSIK
jgi:hypothetical protein